MKKIVGAIVVSIAIVAICGFIYGTAGRGKAQSAQLQSRNDQRIVAVGGQALTVDLATTPAEREQGLSGRKSLAENEGMLFVFPQDGAYKFWMKEMNFPLDIIWLSVDGTVVYIEPGLAPSTYPNSYGPTGPARYVLEVNAGFAAAHGLKVGDHVAL